MNDSRFLRTCADEIFAAMNNRDTEQLVPYLSEEVVFDFPGAGTITEKKRVLLFFKVLFRKYPRLIFTVEDILLEGERACVVWSNEGHDSKGTPYSNRGVTLVRIANEKIVFISDYFKDTSFTAAP